MQLCPTSIVCGLHYRLAFGLVGMAFLASSVLAQDSASPRGSQPPRTERNQQRVEAGDDTFSYIVPADWEVKTLEGDLHPMAFAPLTPGKGFRTNINVVTEAWDESLEEYLAIAVPKLFQQFPQAKEIKRGPFQTNDREKGIRIEFDNTVANLTLRQTFYVFLHKGEIYIFAFSSLKEEVRKFASQGDKIAKTFRFED